MEYTNSPDDEERESLSQEAICHVKPLKCGIESIEDFEDVTKDFSSMKDVTAQFLHYEADDRSKLQSAESDDHFDLKSKSSIQEPSSISLNFSDSVFHQMEKNEKNTEFLEEFLNYPQRGSSDTLGKVFGDSLNSLMASESPTMQLDKSENNQTDDSMYKSNFENEPITSIMDETKLIDVPSNDEISYGSDDLLLMPKTGESSPILYSTEEKNLVKPAFYYNDCEEEAHFNLDSSKSIPEVGLKNNKEPQTSQGDYIQVKEFHDGDISDNDDIVPEPIPKDYPEIGLFEGKEFLEAIGLDTWFHPNFVNPKIESLVYWRDPKKSGVVFGSVMVILLSLTTFSLISVVAYSSLIVLIAALSFRIYKNVLQAVQKTSEGHPFKEYLEFDLTLSPDKAREISDLAVSYINKTLTQSRRLFLVEDIIDSLKFAICLWCLTYVGSWFNGLSLLIIGFVGLFTLPKVYENNKTQIDANLNIVRSKINEITEKIKAVSPLGKKTEDSKNKSD